MRTLAPVLAASLLFAVACTGSLDRPAGPRGAPRPGSGPGPVSCDTPTAPETPLQHLTRVEYDHAVEDLFGDTSRPAQSFAADVVSTGFEVGGEVSPLLAEEYLSAAESIAARAVADPAGLTGCGADEACARAFVESRGRLAFRRRLTSDEVDELMTLYRTGRTALDHATGLRVVITAMLIDPSFLYRVEAAGEGRSDGELVALSDDEIATRMATLVWRSIPDTALLDAAEAGALRDPASRETQLRRMLADPRAARGVNDFYRQWIGLDKLDTAQRDDAAFPEWSPEIARDLRASLLAQVASHTLEGGSLDALLVDGTAYLNERIAPIFGVEGVTGEMLRPVALDPSQRAGLLTHPALLSVFGKSDRTDPIHRGVFVRERMLCQDLLPPPPGVATMPPDVAPGTTLRERFEMHRSEPSCAGCHQLIDPIGFGFESYDAVGRFRTTEEGRPVDTSGEVIGGGDASGTFDGAVDLAQRLSQSETVQQCVARQWFRYARSRIETPEDRCTLDRITSRFVASGLDLRELIVAIATTDEFAQRRITTMP